jgi:hypothetical protein
MNTKKPTTTKVDYYTGAIYDVAGRVESVGDIQGADKHYIAHHWLGIASTDQKAKVFDDGLGPNGWAIYLAEMARQTNTDGQSEDLLDTVFDGIKDQVEKDIAHATDQMMMSGRASEEQRLDDLNRARDIDMTNVVVPKFLRRNNS